MRSGLGYGGRLGSLLVPAWSDRMIAHQGDSGKPDSRYLMTVGLVVTGGEVGQIITGDGSVVARYQGVRQEESKGLLAEMRKLVSQTGLEEDIAEVFAALPGRSFGPIMRASGAADLIG